jgi:hypothetical protein
MQCSGDSNCSSNAVRLRSSIREASTVKVERSEQYLYGAERAIKSASGFVLETAELGGSRGSDPAVNLFRAEAFIREIYSRNVVRGPCELVVCVALPKPFPIAMYSVSEPNDCLGRISKQNGQ